MLSSSLRGVKRRSNLTVISNYKRLLPLKQVQGRNYGSKLARNDGGFCVIVNLRIKINYSIL